MTGTAYPGDAVTGVPTYTATQGRTALAAAMGGATTARPLGGFSGVRPGTATNIATATSTTWTVTPFAGYIDLESLATNGGYFFSFQANETGSVTAAAVSARVDLLYVQVNDSNTGDGSGLSPRVTLGYQAGVAGAGVPALSAARAFVIAQINVPASGGGSPTVTWVAPYTAASGGVVPALSSAAYPAAATNPGQYLDDLATGTLKRSNGTAWVPVAGITGIVPTSVAGTGVTLVGGAVVASAATTVSINGCFTTTFDNYIIIVDVTHSTAAALTGKLRVGGVDSASSLYWQVLSHMSGSTNTVASSSGNAALSVQAIGGLQTVGKLELFQPALPQVTYLSAEANAVITATSSGIGKYVGGYNATTVFDGITFTPSAGTITGTIRVYGYNNL